MSINIPHRTLLLFVVFFMLLALGSKPIQAKPPRVLEPGTRPDDSRLERLTDLRKDYFPFTPPATPEAWARRAEQVRRRVLVATGLWPMPTRTPAHPVVHGKVERDKYTVEKVFLESYPGHFVTGNLYRPKDATGKRPGVLCPHGHWPEGRFYDAGEKAVLKQIVEGAERFERGGRYPIQARCVQLARMGCVVFQYDMVGYADSVQLAHRPGVREPMNTDENWGFFSPQAELRLQNMMGLQTYNSIRALDWFLSLEDVDPRRVAVTGASGGGTQTFMLCAIDPRPAVAFPAVMVSTAMQGGCTCENACYLRIGAGNIELAALAAPRPLGMTAANDWTKEIATKGLPELKQLYKMLGVPDLVMAKPLVHFPHNYNYVSRAVMYAWLNRHLKLGFEEPIVEEDYEPLSREEMSVWDADHPRPDGGEDYERALVRWMNEDAQRQMAALIPKDADSLARYREVVGGAFDVILGRAMPGADEVVATDRKDHARSYGTLSTMLIRYQPEGEAVPVVLLQPKTWNRRVVLWIAREGKQGLFSENGSPGPAVEKLLASGAAVVGIDLFGQGEFTEDGKPIEHQRLNPTEKSGWKAYAGYTYGYNHPVFAKRVHDILSVLAFVRAMEPGVKRVDAIGLAGAGPWVAAARAQAGAALGRVAIDTAGFRFAGIKAFDDPDFLPGGAKYLDLPGLVALSAPHPLWLSGEGDQPAVVVETYEAAGKAENLTVVNDKELAGEEAAIEWLAK